MISARPAQIHGLEAVEIEANQWDPKAAWKPDAWLMYGRLTENKAQWLATSRIEKGQRIIYTFLDDGFDADWGEDPRHLADRGRFMLRADGTLKLRRLPTRTLEGAQGTGTFRVQVGQRSFTCLRVLDLEGEPSEQGILMEAYLTRSGRTVLARRYNGRLWKVDPKGDAKKRRPWDERLPSAPRLVIGGATFVHWYDCLSDAACGIR